MQGKSEDPFIYLNKKFMLQTLAQEAERRCPLKIKSKPRE